MNTSFLATKFERALPYDRYLQTGTDEQRRRWQQVYDAAHLTAEQTQLLAGFQRDMKILIVSGIWCGDCVQQCPLLQRCAEANVRRIDLRLVDRDEHRDLSEQVRLNGGDRVPVVLFLSEDSELCGMAGDRTLSRYRALAARQLGPSCPTGIVPPGADELAATLQDWLNEVERIQLMLRLSPRLRQRHGD
jgi:thioredoxin-like negative regulator of GroEL